MDAAKGLAAVKGQIADLRDAVRKVQGSQGIAFRKCVLLDLPDAVCAGGGG